jgi:hypothetical protein
MYTLPCIQYKIVHLRRLSLEEFCGEFGISFCHLQLDTDFAIDQSGVVDIGFEYIER